VRLDKAKWPSFHSAARQNNPCFSLPPAAVAGRTLLATEGLKSENDAVGGPGIWRMSTQYHSIVVDHPRSSIHFWRKSVPRSGSDRPAGSRDLLDLPCCAAGRERGVPIARPIIETMVLAVVLIVGMLSHRRGAIAAILLGLGSHPWRAPRSDRSLPPACGELAPAAAATSSTFFGPDLGGVGRGPMPLAVLPFTAFKERSYCI